MTGPHPATAVPSPDVQEAAWAEVARLQKEFPKGWEFTWTEYPEGWRFVAKPQPPLTGDPYVIGESAGQVRAGVQLRETPEGGTL